MDVFAMLLWAVGVGSALCTILRDTPHEDASMEVLLLVIVGFVTGFVVFKHPVHVWRMYSGVAYLVIGVLPHAIRGIRALISSARDFRWRITEIE